MPRGPQAAAHVSSIATSPKPAGCCCAAGGSEPLTAGPTAAQPGHNAQWAFRAGPVCWQGGGRARPTGQHRCPTVAPGCALALAFGRLSPGPRGTFLSFLLLENQASAWPLGRSAAQFPPQSKATHSQCCCKHPSPAGTTCSSSSPLHPLLHCLQLCEQSYGPASRLSPQHKEPARSGLVGLVCGSAELSEPQHEPRRNDQVAVNSLGCPWWILALSLLIHTDPHQATAAGPAGWPQRAMGCRAVQSIPGKGQYSPCMKEKKHHKRRPREISHRQNGLLGMHFSFRNGLIATTAVPCLPCSTAGAPRHQNTGAANHPSHPPCCSLQCKAAKHRCYFPACQH